MDDAGARLGQDIARFAHDPNADELGAALLVGRALADEFDSPRCRSLLDQLVKQCPAGSEPWAFLADLGFGGTGDGAFNIGVLLFAGGQVESTGDEQQLLIRSSTRFAVVHTHDGGRPASVARPRSNPSPRARSARPTVPPPEFP